MTVEVNGDKFDYVCDKPRCGWRSIGWNTSVQADTRGLEHDNEHETGQLMTGLREFEASVGFTLDGEGA